MKGQSFAKRLAFAVNGLYLAFCRERSFRIQVAAAAGVVVVLIVTRPPPVWWAIGVIVVSQVLIAELINTAIESLADHLHPDRHPEIKAIKDIAAAAVLLSSIVALLIAIAFLAR